MLRQLRRFIASVLLMWYLPACTYARRIEPITAVAGHETVLATVTLGADIVTWMVDDPWVANDSLFSSAAACQEGCDSPEAQWPVPLSAVIEVKAVTDKSGTATAAVLLVGLAVGVGVLVAAMGGLYR